MKRLALALVVLAIFAGIADAQNYRFTVPEAIVTVTIEADGSATIHYRLTFTCMAGAHPIDIVDIGLPNLSSHTPGTATINGKPIPQNNVRVSTFLKPRGSGYEVHLGQGTIQPGQTGVFEFTARERDMVWQDTTDPEQASFRFTPTWFGAEFLQGSTSLTLRYILPIPEQEYPAVKDRILWQKKGQDFDVKGVMEGEEFVSVAWVETVRLTMPHEYGVSFPKRFVGKVRKDSIFALFLRWFEGSGDAQFVSGIIVLFTFTMCFMILTRGTGLTLYVIAFAGFIFGMVQSAVFHLWLYPGMLVFALLVYWSRQRRKRSYFPAELCREGGGLKRGLTAVEAAVLLEVPLNKILTMVIFGLAKKQLIEVREEDPLRIAVVGSRQTDRKWRRPDGLDVKIWPYEFPFLKAFQAQSDKAVEDMKLDDAFDALIKRVVKSMKDFDVKGTREYYRSIVTRAWTMVEKEAGYEARYDRLDNHLDWLMMDDSWDRKLRDTTVDVPYYPRWWIGHGHSHGPRPSFGGGGSPLPSPSRTSPSTSFGDVASSLVGRFEGMSSNLANSLDVLSSSTKTGLDLSGIDRFTGEVLSALAESGSGGGRGGGGGGFSCACACAGCACACACAGGGR